ncbi:hypothetical protein M2302_002199 [Micromonospora sp. A200]|uniref:DUF2637 domain-containing protein n=1 Tax=Micromonospora sp. A200 TaxID=2940568 RepID=UPI002475F7AF|nr:DUF2637 domain-containing protein [Micromonospora sp. A200]MDH6462024.1 hypothetical protein [Micromonospora sp. A200]
MKAQTEAKGGGLETALLVLILLAVGGMALGASFTHVHDFTMKHSPEGTPHWFGWANAVISELTPTASLLEVRRRGRRGQSIRYPMWVLIGSTAVSLTANLALAVPTFFGWLVAGLPAVAFGVLTKMVLSGLQPAEVPETVPVPAPQVLPQPVPLARPVPMPEVPRVEVPPRPAPVPSEPTQLALVVPGPERRSRQVGTPGDEELKKVLLDAEAVPRNADGTVPVKRAAKVLGTGVDRARRLLDELGLREPVAA